MSLPAANVTWDGGGASNNSGTWETGSNWTGDAIPGTGDDAQLLDVTTGTRTVTISSGSPQTINQLTITQTTIGAVNVLNIDDDLTIDGNANPFDMDASAGQDSIVTNIAAGKTLLASRNNSLTSVFKGTLNLGAGSTFHLVTTTSKDLSGTAFTGPINANGAAAKILFQPDRFVSGGVAFSGPITVADAGNSLVIQRLNATPSLQTMSATFSGSDGSGDSVSLGAGTQMDIDVRGGTMDFTNRVTLAGTSGTNAGAIFNVGLSGASAITANFNGGLVMGEGAKTTVNGGAGGGATATLAGVSSLASGSELLLEYTNAAGAVSFTNSGTLSMDDAALNFDWAAASSNSSLTRKFENTGTWTLQNGSTVAFTTTTGRPTVGFGVGTKNDNSGTLNVESGSEMGFQDLFNVGTMNLGSSTSGTSAALVTLGSPDNTFRDVTLTNGVTSGGTDTAGTINVNGDAFLGRTTFENNSTTTLNNGDATSTGSVINVGDGTVAATFTVANATDTTTNDAVVVNNFAGNTINLNANGTFHLKSNAEFSTRGNVIVSNDGTLVHAGSLVLQGSFSGTRAVTTSSTGIYRVSGTSAILESLPTASGAQPTNVPDVIFSVNGQLSGASASDKLTYENNTGNVAREYLGIGVLANGEITPGLGTNGGGTTSIGSLELVDVNMSLISGGKMDFDIGGTVGSGLFDELTLTLATPGSGAILDLNNFIGSTTLDIWTVNSFTPTGGTYQIITADSVVGTFDTLQFNGAALSGEYSVNYLANGVEILFVPEPSTAVLLLGGIATGLLAFRRRRVS